MKNSIRGGSGFKNRAKGFIMLFGRLLFHEFIMTNRLA